MAGRCSHCLPTKKCRVTSLCSFKLSAPSQSQIFQCFECQPLVLQVPFCTETWNFALLACTNGLFILPLPSLILPYVMSAIKPMRFLAKSHGSLQRLKVCVVQKMAGNLKQNVLWKCIGFTKFNSRQGRKQLSKEAERDRTPFYFPCPAHPGEHLMFRVFTCTVESYFQVLFFWNRAKSFTWYLN